MRLFRLKRLLGNYFTTLCVFGTYEKLGQTEIALHVDCKKLLLTRKTISVLILPSIVLHFSHNPHTLLTRTYRHHTLSPSSAVSTHQRERGKELHPLPHANLSSTHSSLSAADPHTYAPLSFLHCLSSIWVRLPHLTFDPHTSAQQSLSLMPAKPYPPPTSLICRQQSQALKPTLNLSLFLPPLTNYIMYMLWINVFIFIFGCVKYIFWNFLL